MHASALPARPARPLPVPARPEAPQLTRREAIALASVLAASLAAGSALTHPALADEEGVARPQDDFYDAVNHDLIASWELPADKGRITTLTQMSDTLKEKLNDIVRDAAVNPGDDPDRIAVGACYATGMDVESRQQGGFGPTVESYLARIEEAPTVADLFQVIMQISQLGFGSFLVFDVDPDPYDSATRILHDTGPDAGPNKGVWDDAASEGPSSQATIDASETFLARLWEIAGTPSAEAARIASDVTELRRTLAAALLTENQSYDPSLYANILTIEQFCELYQNAIAPEQFARELGIPEDSLMCVHELEAQRLAGSYFTDENLPLLKEYVATTLLSDVASCASPEAADAKAAYEAVRTGLTSLPDLETTVLDELDSIAGFQAARLYCTQYFPEDSKADVTEFTQRIVETFGKRVDGLDWMDDATKQGVHRKLDTLQLNVGYPDTWPQDAYGDLELAFPDEGGLFVENVLQLTGASMRRRLATLVDETLELPWGMVPHEINAYYDTSNNSVNIVAGILQTPIYDPEASRARNLGAIGSVIAHEITHAFDADGSQYDEHGNVANWWSDACREHFQELADRVVAYYDGCGAPGAQTLSENIADLGGVACVAQIAQEEGLDLTEFFEGYATIWAAKTTDEFAAYLLAVDTHAPYKVRINAVLSALGAFYETYDVQEGDGMWVAPEDRPRIW